MLKVYKMNNQLLQEKTTYAEYFTATILEWKKLLKPDKYKNIIINSFHYLVKEKRILIYGFVVMYNHIHVIWQTINGENSIKNRQGFMKYTAQQIKFDLQKNHPKVLERFYVGASDREYQFWERNPLSVEIYAEKVFWEKLDYIHWNPVKAGLCNMPEKYKYSSAKFYEEGIDEWGFISHYVD
jgi:REP element-mobilizing transposase RayT